MTTISCQEFAKQRKNSKLSMDHNLVLFISLVAVFITSCVTAKPVSDSEEHSFDELLATKIKENEERGGNLHGHITAVNDAHREEKRKTSGAVEEAIEDVNEAANIDLFEGDITVEPGLPLEYSQFSEEQRKRNIIKASHKKWTSRVVPYSIPPEMNFMRSKISAAVEDFRKRTCVRFKEVPTSYSRDHIKLVRSGGCSSSVGRSGGAQKLSLGKGCEMKGVIIHEMMHALGIWHEQSRPDRDQYVEILWNNIKKGKKHNFKKYPHGKLDTLNLPYDTFSIMHYDRFLFSIDRRRKPTIIARGRPWASLGGQLRGTFTDNDAKEINSLFGC